MDPKFRPRLARRITMEVLRARKKLTHQGIEGLSMMADDCEVPEWEFYQDRSKDCILEFKAMNVDMEEALAALETLGYTLLKVQTPEALNDD